MSGNSYSKIGDQWFRVVDIKRVDGTKDTVMTKVSEDQVPSIFIRLANGEKVGRIVSSGPTIH